jgi:ribosomal protein S12 methylthiotransferase accessory factor
LIRAGTSLRSRPPEETIDVARGLMPQLGITRLIDATERDCLTLPVFLTHRPGGRTSRIHAGKGLAAADACAGALMEAVEYSVAELHSSAGADVSLPLGDLSAALPAGLRLADFSPRLGVAADLRAQTPAVFCEELVSSQRVLLPAELVLVPFEPASSVPMFGWSTNGLASGNSLEEATLHALLEVLERDALAMNLARDESRLVPNASLPMPFRELAIEWASRGIELVVRSLPDALGLPCFVAAVLQPRSRRVRVSRGWGYHFRRDIALARAICEAAQIRILVLQDAGHDRIGATHEERLLARLVDTRRVMRFEDAPHLAPRSIRSASNELLGRLGAAGFSRVFRRQMLPAGDAAGLRGLHVVKVVVPLCEFASGTHIRMSPRLIAHTLGNAPRSRSSRPTSASTSPPRPGRARRSST